MWGVALLTLVGLLWASANAEALHALPSFVKGLFIPELPMPRPWGRGPATADRSAFRSRFPHLRKLLSSRSVWFF